MNDQELHLRKIIDKLESENATLLLALKESHFYVSSWEPYDRESANKQYDTLEMIESVLDSQTD